MRAFSKRAVLSVLVGIGLAGSAAAADILVTSDITTSTTWTANNSYNLQKQIYVRPGATLTIEPGTIIASDTGVGGSLAVNRRAQIFVLGTRTSPVVMTSTRDRSTWTNDCPQTGTWTEAVNEWGNLTIMGGGYISEDENGRNSASPKATNRATMEGLTPAFTGDTRVLYGGGNDNSDSGIVQYLSLRFGGRVIGLNNELNGLSLGGVGRETDINHIEIMNNVDDGIEIWGGTVNIKNFSIWNIGDDSFDVDQGWRGKAQFGLIVQGYSTDDSQGSGVGDNAFETDGAENSDFQPVTTASIWNCTVIGQPSAGDHGTAWRDNARVQYHACTFMDLGEELVKFDNIDGDGGMGYGNGGTLSWADTWTTSYTETSTVNPFDGNAGKFYNAQSSGALAQISDSVFFRNFFVDAYTEGIARGIFAGNDNVLTPGFDPLDQPIRSLSRDLPITKGGKLLVQVSGLDPRADNAALVSVTSAPDDGFFTPVMYRGAFSPTSNWLCGWSASDAFGFLECGTPLFDPCHTPITFTR